jgi:hypothetical protein
MISWLAEFLSSCKSRWTGNEMIENFYGAVTAIDFAFSEMYRQNFFVYGEIATRIAEAGVHYCQSLSRATALCYTQKKLVFLQKPKLHMLFHTFAHMLAQVDTLGFAINPLSESVPMGEDFIGRVSRQSRRVGPKLVVLRTIQSYLVKLHSIWAGPP